MGFPLTRRLNLKVQAAPTALQIVTVDADLVSSLLLSPTVLQPLIAALGEMFLLESAINYTHLLDSSTTMQYIAKTRTESHSCKRFSLPFRLPRLLYKIAR